MLFTHRIVFCVHGDHKLCFACFGVKKLQKIIPPCSRGPSLTPGCSRRPHSSLADDRPQQSSRSGSGGRPAIDGDRLDARLDYGQLDGFQSLPDLYCHVSVS